MKAYVQSIIKKRVLQQPKYTLDFKKGKKKTCLSFFYHLKKETQMLRSVRDTERKVKVLQKVGKYIGQKHRSKERKEIREKVN